MDFLEIVKERGFLHQCTDDTGLRKLLDEHSGVPAYIGFDCTAPSLHAGSLVPIMMLYWWQQCGHKPIVLMGGGTTKVGDPSGKDESRKMLSNEDIASNMEGIKKNFMPFIQFGENTSDAIMVNNDEWLSELNYIDLLQNYGRHFSINRMLTMESVKHRLERESHLSFLEFNYMILQAYDFVELHRRHGCRLQMGGSDQWGNIVMGCELYRRTSYTEAYQVMPGDNGEHEFVSFTASQSDDDVSGLDNPIFGLTTSLLTTASGAKMGKTTDGAIWLNADMCSPYDYWQYWRNVEDGDVIRFLKLFTTLPLTQIAEYESWLGSAQINDAKKILATEATAMLHGREAAEAAAKTAQKTFEEGTAGDDLPEYIADITALQTGMLVSKLLVETGLAKSGGEARRTIKGGGARINGIKVEDTDQVVSMNDMTDRGYVKLSSGKKRHALVKVAS